MPSSASRSLWWRFCTSLLGCVLKMPGVSDEHDLAFGTMDDAVIGVARGLRFGRDDGDLGADQRIEQRGFADVGATDEHGEAGFEI